VRKLLGAKQFSIFLVACFALITTDSVKPIGAGLIRSLLEDKPRLYGSFFFGDKGVVNELTIGVGEGWRQGKILLVTGSTKDFMEGEMVGRAEAYARLEHYACSFTQGTQVNGKELSISIFAPIAGSGVDEVIPEGRRTLFIGSGGWPQAVEGLGWTLILEIYGKKGRKILITVPYEEKLDQFPPEAREIKPWQKKLQPVFTFVKEKLLSMVYQPKYRVYPRLGEVVQPNQPCERPPASDNTPFPEEKRRQAKG